MPAINTEAIPDELKDRDQWLLWDASADTPRRPHWAGNFSVSWSDPDAWHSFEEAVEAADARASWGIGYVTAADNPDYARGLYGVIDLDGAADEDQHSRDWVPSLAPFFDRGAYVEWSPSGQGIHIPVVGMDVPDWWRDTQLPDDEHTGVDVLTHKFCTFTGDSESVAGADVVEYGEWVDAWLADAYEALTGETAPPREDADAADPSVGSDRDDWLTADVVRDALGHIDPDVGYPVWRNIGFGLADEFDDATAERLFVEWSRGGSKWDREAEDRAERIINDADPAASGDVSIGTVIYHAKEGGWSPPAKESADLDAVEEPPEVVRDGGATTEEGAGDVLDLNDQVHAAIAAFNDDEVQAKTARHRIATAFVQEHSFVYPEDEVRGWRSTLYVFNHDEGVYEPRGERFVEAELERIAGDFVTNQTRNEIVEKIKRMSSERGEAFMTPPEKLVVGNGILDLHTGELEAYTPDEYHRTKIGVEWNPDAGDPDAIDEFLHDIVRPEDVPTLYRLIAHTLYKEYATEKAAMLVGSGQNGKSVFLELVEKFLGGENVTHRALQEFDENEFAANQLAGKLANVHPDMGDAAVTDMSTFKKLTGRDTMLANVKYEQPIKFENYATLMFAANEMPVFGEDNHAVWRRWLYIDFPHTFNEHDADAKDPEPKRVLMRRLTDEAELEALLYRCQQEIQEWFGGREWFASAMRPDEVREQMKKAAEPIYNFASVCLQDADDEWLPKERVRECYRLYAEEEGLPKLPESQFGERLMGLRDYQIDDSRRRENGSRVQTYDGIQFSSRGRQVLGLDHDSDEAQAGADDQWDQAKPKVLEELAAMVELNEGEAVDRDALMWRCTGSGIGKANADQTIDILLEEGEIYDTGDGLLPV